MIEQSKAVTIVEASVACAEVINKLSAACTQLCAQHSPISEASLVQKLYYTIELYNDKLRDIIK